jgi:hypothetical protein
MHLTQRQLRRLIESEVNKMHQQPRNNDMIVTNDKSMRDVIVANIAQTILHINSLETRNSDSYDFHDVAVSSLKRALEAAFDAGLRSSKK